MIGPADRLTPWPEWIDARLVEETKATWSPRYGRALTSDEAVEILLSVGRLVDLLQEQQR